jgi:ribonuclease J
MSAQIIPGNEELVHRTINRLYQRGARVVYDELAPVHVSGHASQEEQKLLIHLMHPKYLVPIHGELRHLHAHARLAVEMGMPRENILLVENGYVLEFTPERATIGERVPGGYVFVDGAGIGDVGPSLMREREQLARDGFVVVVIPRTAGGELAAAPRIVTRGLVYQPQATDLLDGITARAQELIDKHRSVDEADLEEAIHRSLEDYIYTETKRRPVVSALLSPFT